MNLFTKHILMLALAVLPGAGLRAQTAGAVADVSANKWSVYVQAGVSGFNGLRGYEKGSYKSDVAPDVKLGATFNPTSWFRAGVAFAFTCPGTSNTSMNSTTATIQDFKIGNYTGSLTTRSVELLKRNEMNIFFGGLSAEFNLLPKVKVLDIWLGTGIGSAFSWVYNVSTTAVSEEGKAQGDGYYNVYSHDYIVSATSDIHTDALYVPLTASFEFAVSKLVKLTLSGDYKFITGKQLYTTNATWSVDAGVRFTF